MPDNLYQPHAGEPILRRMIRPQEAPWEKGKLNTLRALRAALPKAADDALSLPLEVVNITATDLGQEDMLAGIDADSLLLLLQTEEGRCAIAALDPQLIAALIEIQTMGRIIETPADARSPTATDAALSIPFVDVLLGEFAYRLEGEQPLARFAGFGVERQMEERRQASLVLSEAVYSVFAAEVDLGGGAKRGYLHLGFPELPVDEKDGPDDAGQWAEAMRENVLRGEVTLDARLATIPLTINEVESLSLGQMFEFPMAALSSIELVAGEGSIVSRGKLGQADGRRAVMITDGENAGLDLPPLPQSPTDPLAAFGADAPRDHMAALLDSGVSGTGIPDDLPPHSTGAEDAVGGEIGSGQLESQTVLAEGELPALEEGSEAGFATMNIDGLPEMIE